MKALAFALCLLFAGTASAGYDSIDRRWLPKPIAAGPPGYPRALVAALLEEFLPGERRGETWYLNVRRRDWTLQWYTFDPYIRVWAEDIWYSSSGVTIWINGYIGPNSVWYYFHFRVFP